MVELELLTDLELAAYIGELAADYVDTLDIARSYYHDNTMWGEEDSCKGYKSANDTFDEIEARLREARREVSERKDGKRKTSITA